MSNKRFWYDISETGDYTEYKTKHDIEQHLTNALTNKEKAEVTGCHCYQQYSNAETTATYEIRFTRKGAAKLVKVG